MHSGGDRLMLVGGYHLSEPFMHSIELPFSLTRRLFGVLYGVGIPGGLQFV